MTETPLARYTRRMFALRLERDEAIREGRLLMYLSDLVRFLRVASAPMWRIDPVVRLVPPPGLIRFPVEPWVPPTGDEPEVDDTEPTR